MMADSSRRMHSKTSALDQLIKVKRSPFFNIPSKEDVKLAAQAGLVISLTSLLLILPLIIFPNKSTELRDASLRASDVREQRVTYEKCMRAINSKEHCYTAAYIKKGD